MAAEALLALWNDTPTRRAIVDFVQAVRFARTCGREALRLLVLHDDADRSAVFASA